jgi:hypothetical protein
MVYVRKHGPDPLVLDFPAARLKNQTNRWSRVAELIVAAQGMKAVFVRNRTHLD